jgi:hypothetical protein
MSIATTKLDLAKRLIETNNKGLINHIKAVFDSQPDEWFETLPVEVQASVERGIKQADQDKTKPHAEVMKKFKKWAKK